MTEQPKLERYTIDAKGLPFFDDSGEYVLFADVEAYTKAAIAAAMQGAVKPLEWKECYFDINSKQGDTHYARSMVDVSPIAIHRHPLGWWLSIDSNIYKFLESAKAAAQADYQARILSALSIPTDANQTEGTK